MRIGDYIERMNQAATQAEACEILIEQVGDMGFDAVAYGVLSEFQQTGNLDYLRIILSFPDAWVAHYVEKGYTDIDPINQYSRLARNAFRWNAVAQLDGISKRQQRVINESQDAGLRQGVSVPLFGPRGEHAVLSLATSDPKLDTESQLSTLYIMASQFHLVHQSRAEVGTDIKLVSLTPREREVLSWSARGKSNGVIADLMGLSPSAVNFHVVNAMRKLEAGNRIVAVLKAIRHGLICP